MTMRKTGGFWGFTNVTPSLPKLYWDVKSQEQRVLNLFELINRIICYIENMDDISEELRAEIEELRAEFKEFRDGEMVDRYIQILTDWINANAERIVKQLITQVYFGLTLEGYFVAYIPESWNDIVFDTGADYSLDTYGRLILRWDADSPYTVEQPPEIVRPQTAPHLYQNQRNIMHTLYTPDEG